MYLFKCPFFADMSCRIIIILRSFGLRMQKITIITNKTKMHLVQDFSNGYLLKRLKILLNAGFVSDSEENSSPKTSSNVLL